jgi:hypothetical protein
MKGWLKFVILMSAFALTIYLTSYISRLPESNCTSGSVLSSWSSDHTYKATLLKKDCNQGETIFYSVRIDKVTPTRINGVPMGGWFLVEDIEEDPYPTAALQPAIKWTAHRLQIDIPARTFSGSYQHREGDLTLVRSYIAEERNSN